MCVPLPSWLRRRLCLAVRQVGTTTALYLATATAGVSYGGLNGITPPICTELFGLKSFGAIYTGRSSAAANNSAAGALLFATDVPMGKRFQWEIYRERVLREDS